MWCCLTSYLFLVIYVNLCIKHAVVQDIVGEMFYAKCVKELFRPQKVLSTNSLKVIFSKLAHSSIMKLNEAAMDKVRESSMGVL